MCIFNSSGAADSVSWRALSLACGQPPACCVLTHLSLMRGHGEAAVSSESTDPIMRAPPAVGEAAAEAGVTGGERTPQSRASEQSWIHRTRCRRAAGRPDS